jgi:hypothetical protein
MGQRRGVYRVLVGKPEGKRPAGRPRRRWEDNIKMDLQEVGYWGMDWIELAQERDRRRALVNAVMNLRVPQNAVNFLTSCKTVSFSRRTLFHGIKCKEVSNLYYSFLLPELSSGDLVFSMGYDVKPSTLVTRNSCFEKTIKNVYLFIPLTPNDLFICRTASLTSRRCILYI